MSQRHNKWRRRWDSIPVFLLVTPFFYLLIVILKMAKSSLEVFDHGDFTEYNERLDFFFTANDIGVVTSASSSAEKTKADRKRAAYLVSLKKIKISVLNIENSLPARKTY